MRHVNKIAVLFVLTVALGFGFPSVKAEAPENIHYIAIGDSLTYGLGASEQEYLRIDAFVPRFVRHLKSTRNVYVENHGIPGITSTELNLFLEQDEGLQKTLSSANLITVTIGANDFVRILRTMPDVSEQQALLTTLENMKNQIQQLNQTLRELSPKAVIIYIGLYDPFPENHKYSQISKTFVPIYNDFLKSLADTNTVVADPSPAFLGRVSELTHIADGDNHPNDDGYAQIAQSVIEAYEKR